MATHRRGPLTERQLLAVEGVERAMSVISLFATMFIFVTFVTFDFFRKPRNRLVFWASLGNAMTNVATLVSVSGIAAGPRSALCQFQGFLLQVFMPADTLWTLCMALNVYFTFFRRYSAADLRRFEKWYLLLCYASTLVPALIYLILDHAADTGIYGPAVIWCWVSMRWEWMRVAFFYGPVWICILATMSIYIWTGKNVLKQRAALRAFSENGSAYPSPTHDPVNSLDLANVTRMTEITVTTEAIRSASRDDGVPQFDSTYSSSSSTRKLSGPDAASAPDSRKSSGVLEASKIALHRPFTTSPTATCTATVTTGSTRHTDSSTNMEGHPLDHTRSNNHRKTVNNANKATIGYAKVAVPMFLAMLIVWVPSTINRVYSLVAPGKPNFTLNLIAATVLPTQGFWNAVIYVITSWSQCRAAWRQLRYGERPSGHPTSRKPSNTSEILPGSSSTAQPLRPGPGYDGSSGERPTRLDPNRQLSLLEAMAMSPEDELNFDWDVEKAIPASARPKFPELAMDQRYAPRASPDDSCEMHMGREELEGDGADQSDQHDTSHLQLLEADAGFRT